VLSGGGANCIKNAAAQCHTEPRNGTSVVRLVSIDPIQLMTNEEWDALVDAELQLAQTRKSNSVYHSDDDASQVPYYIYKASRNACTQ
jgi:hypothetical protein